MTTFAQVLKELCDPNAEPARRCTLLGSIDNAQERINRAIAFGYSDLRVSSIMCEEWSKVFAARDAHKQASAGRALGGR